MIKNMKRTESPKYQRREPQISPAKPETIMIKIAIQYLLFTLTEYSSSSEKTSEHSGVFNLNPTVAQFFNYSSVALESTEQ